MNRLLLLLLSLTLLTAACQKESSEAEPKSLLDGRWYAKSADYIEYDFSAYIPKSGGGFGGGRLLTAAYRCLTRK
ncbi:hypothetical protein K3G63_03275 [Hymenobacter sp. HSC-4F20]|uniref:hypothetical protein n=1 Tax=Hymenobacter sp. HSC-4F20 TaxID=2864135 RepID=UPI001C73AECB|nr:hypothetical protein [Hymenobacter sp. HSC-4F20]MBX0289440.1 hypothetical protein [Hymenobacter sp. HSC-4F20]